jgi:serine/threonine protein kinase
MSWAVEVPVGYRVGPWLVTRGIATGSWGSVYEARRPDGSRVALKFLPTGTVTPRQLRHLRDMAEREVRFHRRDEQAGSLDASRPRPAQFDENPGSLDASRPRPARYARHPRLIRCFDVLTVDDPADPELDGAVVLVMELAECSLADLIRRAGGSAVPDAERLVEQLCQGLAHLHEQGWVHGDLKPGNVLVMADGSVRLADFGLTAEIEGTHAYLPPVGSSDYTPPERWTEQLSERGIAARASGDVWAFGVTAYELLTGRHPFPGGGPRARALSAAQQAASGTAPTIPADVSPDWRAILADCLAPTHATRAPHTAASLLVRVQAVVSGTGDAGPPPSRRRLRLVASAGLALVAVLACVAFTQLRDPGTGDRRGGPAGGARTASTPAVAETTNLPPTSGGVAARPVQSTMEYRPDLLKAGVGIPAQYRQLIVEAGTGCAADGLSPALVAAMLKVESDFDPDLSDPGKDEFGIARWTPRVLMHHLPAPQPTAAPKPPFPPAMSIPAVGRFLCYLSPRLKSVPGDPALLLAAAYRTSAATVSQAGGVPPELRAHTDRVGHFLKLYRP